MGGRPQLPGLVGRVVAVLLVLSSCAGGGVTVLGTSAAPTSASGSVSASTPGGHAVTPEGPLLTDLDGLPLRAEHAVVVKSVYRALAAADLDALRTLYAGRDWPGQAALLAQPPVRQSVLRALETHPANLGEGYVYPGFSVVGWAGPVERADGQRLGIDPATSPDPTTPDPTSPDPTSPDPTRGYPGYRTAFFLDYDPPEVSGGPLRWRGIALLTTVHNP